MTVRHYIESPVEGEAEVKSIDFGDTPPLLVVPFGDVSVPSSRADHVALNRLLDIEQGQGYVVLGLAVDTAPLAACHLAMPPAVARELAADLLALADKLDGGKGKQ